MSTGFIEREKIASAIAFEIILTSAGLISGPEAKGDARAKRDYQKVRIF